MTRSFTYSDSKRNSKRNDCRNVTTLHRYCCWSRTGARRQSGLSTRSGRGRQRAERRRGPGGAGSVRRSLGRPKTVTQATHGGRAPRAPHGCIAAAPDLALRPGKPGTASAGRGTTCTTCNSVQVWPKVLRLLRACARVWACVYVVQVSRRGRASTDIIRHVHKT